MLRSILPGTLLAALLLGCGGESPAADERTASVAQDIFNGTAATSQSPYQHVTIEGWQIGSGTLLSNRWVLTAKHLFINSTTGVPYGPPSDYAAFQGRPEDGWIENDVEQGFFHPTRDVALLRLAAPATVNGSQTNHLNTLYTGTDSSLIGKTLDCWGYGDNRYESGPPDFHTAGYSFLRRANLTVTNVANGFLEIPPLGGKNLFSGDSGTSCIWLDGLGNPHLAGVHANSDKAPPNVPTLAREVAPSTFRSWMNQTMTGGAQTLGSTSFLHPTAVAGFDVHLQMKYIELYVTGTNGDVWVKYSYLNADGSLNPWSDWLGLGGSTPQGPSAVMFGNDVFLFIRHSSGVLHYARRDQNFVWTNWTSIGAPSGTTLASAPAAVVVGPEVWVFAVTTGGVMRYRRFAGGIWQAWQSMSSPVFTGDPAVAYLDNFVYLFGKSGSGISYKFYDRSSGVWQPSWSAMGNSGWNGPAAAVRGNRLDLFVTTSSSELTMRTLYGDLSWSTTNTLPVSALRTSGGVPIAPAAVSRGGSTLDLYTIRTDGSIERRQNPF